jgi:uracil-DNA glycosylase
MKGFLPTSATVSKSPLPLIPRCNACKLYRQCKSPKMEIAGEGRRKILVYGEAPGKFEDDNGVPFVGKAGQLLEKTLHKFGVNLRKDCWIGNGLRCRPPDNRKPTKTELEYCHPFYAKALKELKPNIVIPLGAAAIQTVLMEIWKDEGISLEKWAGWRIPCQKINAWICPTYHPSFVNRSEMNAGKPNPLYPVIQGIFENHLKAAFELDGRPWDPVPDFRSQVKKIISPDKASIAIKNLMESGKPLAFDYETTTLKPDGEFARIVCCAISDGITSVAYPWVGSAIETTKEFLRSPIPKIAQNLKMEYRYTEKLFGLRVRNWRHDTMQGMHVIDNRRGINGLKFQTFVWLGLSSYNEHIEAYLKPKDGGANSPNRITELDLSDLLGYCGLDSLVTAKIAERQENLLLC